MGAKRLGPVFALLKSVYRRVTETRVQMLAAALAYYAAFSLGPLLLLLAGWLGVVLQNQPELATEYRDALTSLLADVLPLQVDAADLVSRSFDLVVGELNQGALLRTIVSLLVLVWASGNFFTSLQHALEVIFEVREARAFWRKRLVAVLLVSSVAVVVAIEVVGGVLASGLRELSRNVNAWLTQHGAPLQDLPISLEPLADLQPTRLLAAVSAFTLTFRYLPRRSSTWLGALGGAVISVLGITIMRSLLVTTFNAERFNLVYGVITSLLAVLLWLYLALLLFLVGAAVAAEVSAMQRRRTAASVAFEADANGTPSESAEANLDVEE
ncbi:MAG: YhjD/YihY/BrkB family envelope integrity protein [Trueperaceae bacterium]